LAWSNEVIEKGLGLIRDRGLGHFPRTPPEKNANNVVEIEAGVMKQLSRCWIDETILC